MAKKKVLTLFTATTMAALMTISMAACGDPTTPNGKDPEVTGIEITTAPAKTHYVLGDTFDPTGMIVSKTFDNNTTEVIPATEYTYSPSTALKLTDKNVTVTWTSEADVDYTAKTSISVTNEVVSVDVITPPAKTTYIRGELFDPTGMTIQATLENGDKEDVIEVNKDIVEYNALELTANDSPLKMIYGGCEFNCDIEVKCGAIMEAEDGIPITSGVEVGAAPNKVAIEADINNLPGKTGDGDPFVRGIDIGCQGVDPNGDTVTITQSRVDSRNYIFDPNDADYCYEDFCATGGGNVASLAPDKNIMVFDRSGEGSVMYTLRADKAGNVNLTLRMSVSDPDNSSVAPETLLSDVLEITVNGTKITIPATSKLAEVDFSQKKSYTPSTTELSTLGDIKGTFDNSKAPRTKYYWQDVTVPVSMIEGNNTIIIRSLITDKRDMVIDSLSFDGDADKVSLFNECAFAPEVVSAKMKVENDKVYMGLIVDTKSVGYTEEEVLNILGLTRVKSVSNCTWSGNINESGSSDKNDPWTSPTSYGGLGYTEPSLLYTHSMAGNWKDRINEREILIEKITDGEFADLYYVWMEVTIPADTKLGTTPDKNRYIGAAYFSGFTYGKDYANVHPTHDVLKTGDSTCVENGGYCYQVFCDTRDRYAGFFAGNEINIILVVQDGTFDATKATDVLPLRSKLMRRYTTNLADNDQELVDLHKS